MAEWKQKEDVRNRAGDTPSKRDVARFEQAARAAFDSHFAVSPENDALWQVVRRLVAAHAEKNVSAARDQKEALYALISNEKEIGGKWNARKATDAIDQAITDGIKAARRAHRGGQSAGGRAA